MSLTTVVLQEKIEQRGAPHCCKAGHVPISLSLLIGLLLPLPCPHLLPVPALILTLSRVSGSQVQASSPPQSR